MVPTISSVVLDTTTILNTDMLQGTETDLKITATVTDDTGVTSVHAFLFDPLLGHGGNETVLTLISGTDLDGTHQGTMFIPLDVDNADYQIVILATNAATVPDDYGTYGLNDDRILHILRDESGEPPGPVEPGETDTKDNGCCKVTININAGPVNIYVCDPEKKIEIPP